MIVCHFSDWHGSWRQLPIADIYVCTGDMFRNYPTVLPDGSKSIDPTREAACQKEWILMQGDMRRYLGNYSAPVICVRGNHDYVDLSNVFGGEVWEVDLDPARTVDIDGRRFGGMRGIPYIAGEWNDEEREWELWHRQANIPRDIDVLVTHVPPYQVLDLAPNFVNYGSKEVRSYVDCRAAYAAYAGAKPLRAHFFGHIHKVSSCRLGDTLYSNAATGYVLHEI